MKTRTDASFGVIPLLHTESDWLVFLIHQIGRKGDTFWTFPKGHLEIGETEEAAARRELFEEAGLTVREILPFTYTQQYTFVHEGEQIDKTVVYYLGIADSQKYNIQEKEVTEARWFSCREAQEKLSFEKTKEILAQVAKDLHFMYC